MTAGWLVVILVGASTAVMKALGPIALGRRRLPPKLAPVLALLAPTLFAALVATQVFARGRELTVDARVIGLLAAAAGAHLRAPAPVVLVAAAAATAAARLLLR
jgi:branched-subunit amino acid transport protein